VQDFAWHFDPLDDWHTYAMEWTPDYIAFSVDGVEMKHIDGYSSEAVKFQNKAQSLRMNLWTPTGDDALSRGLDDSKMPWFALYDYVEVYRWEESTNEFMFGWRDDFHDFNHNRWHKAEGGFEENSSAFCPDNVYTSHGKLVIKMDTEENHKKELEGYNEPGHHFHGGEYVHEHGIEGEYPMHNNQSNGMENGGGSREKYLKKLDKLYAEE